MDEALSVDVGGDEPRIELIVALDRKAVLRLNIKIRFIRNN